MKTTKDLVFYDNSCALCNRYVNFIMKYDKNYVFLFAPLSGKTAEQIPEVAQQKLLGDSVLVFKNRLLYSEAQAVIEIFQGIPRFKLLAKVLNLLPKNILSGVYRLVARNRYRVFGRVESCPLRTEEHAGRFLD